MISARFCLLLFLATVRHVYSAIEQPISSTLKYIPYFDYLRKVLNLCTSAGAAWDYCSLQLAVN